MLPATSLNSTVEFNRSPGLPPEENALPATFQASWSSVSCRPLTGKASPQTEPQCTLLFAALVLVNPVMQRPSDVLHLSWGIAVELQSEGPIPRPRISSLPVQPSWKCTRQLGVGDVDQLVPFEHVKLALPAASSVLRSMIWLMRAPER